MTNIFDSKGKFCPLSSADIEALAPADAANYAAVADAASKCEAAEQLCISLESELTLQTAEIRATEQRLAKHAKPTFMDNWRATLQGQ
jgi:hypothetical protein